MKSYYAACGLVLLAIVFIAFVLFDTPQAREDEMARLSGPLRNFAIAEDGYSFVGGNPDGDVTVTEYFDYRCGYCKSVRPQVLRLIDEDPNVRLVLKEFPVLGKSSVAISKIAMAALRQGGMLYWAYHNALMAESHLTEERALMIATKVGLDMDRLHRDRADPKIAGHLSSTGEEGRHLGATGTPAFLIGDKFLPGAISYDKMRNAVRAARAKKGV